MKASRGAPKRPFESLALIGLLASLSVSLLAALRSSSNPGLLTAGRSGQSSQHRTAVKKTSPAAPAKEHPVPFRVGETLSYHATWSVFSNAASLQLTVPERRELFGWPTWHFRAVVHTLGSVRSIFELDDQFDSYTDSVTLEGRQFESHLNEMGHAEDQVAHFVASGQVSPVPTPRVVVPSGTRDPLGALYALRGMDWERTPELRAPVYDGQDLFEMRAVRDATNETVRTPAGTFSAARISVRVFQYGKEVSAIHFTMWVANDAANTPVAMQADLPFGSIRAELISAPR
jgi:Protein of unknown function (DUF3108)